MNLSDDYESDAKSVTSSRRNVRNKWDLKNGLESNISSSPKEYDNWRNRNGDPNLSGSRRTVREFDWRSRERSEMDQFQNTQALDKVEYLEQDRAELLRKLDALDKQITKSSEPGDRSKEIFHQERRVIHQDPYGGSMEHSRTLYMDSNRHQMASSSSQVQIFSDSSFRSQMSSRLPSRQHNSYFRMDNKIPTTNPRHHPSCSCIHCYNEQQQRFSDIIPNSPTFYNQEISNPNPQARRFDQKLSNPLPSRRLNESNSGGFSGHRPRRLPLAAASCQRCSPVAGGAPFITCFNCFELLQLPTRSSTRANKNQKKLKCSACSTVIFYTITNNKLAVSNQAEEKKPEMAIKEVVDRLSTKAKWASTDFSIEDYDSSAYDFQAVDAKATSPSLSPLPTASPSPPPPPPPSPPPSTSTEMRSHQTKSSLSVSEDEDSSPLITRKNRSGSLEPPPFTEKPPPPPNGSALQEHLDYSTKYNPLNHVPMGIQSGINEEKALNSSIKDDELGTNATEIELSGSDFYNTGNSQDSGEGSRGEYQVKYRRGGESYFGGDFKSFNDNMRSKIIPEEGKMSNVTVNGHLIYDHLIKKAEKLAGNIQPGDYWYDFRAGFWGVMGGPCLGIIPPFIEEFNYKMRRDCAGGNTGILVNGRELTKKDMNLLGSRGLPSDENKSYILEISGRILDVDSGEELVSLGKLAPTIEKMKRGFGMKIPKSARNA